MGDKNRSAISRREFARRAAFASAAASLAPGDLLKAQPAASPAPQSSDLPKLPPESQAEVDLRLHAVFAQYGSRLSDAQKADLTRIAYQGQSNLDRIRAYPIDNGDGPGLYLKPLIEHERKPAPRGPGAKPAAAPAAPAKP
jgi:hypothetical protein